MPFVKGQSGNPGGMPKGLGEVKQLARQHTKDAIKALVAVLKTGESESARVAAATTILNRGWGMPQQHIEATVAHSFTEALRQLERISREPAGLGTSLAEIPPLPVAVRH